MYIQIALIVSVLLQFGAFFITISLIPKTKYSISWIMISIGFFLMAFRRLEELIDIAIIGNNTIQTLLNSWIAVLISLLMFGASFYIRRIFSLQDKVDKMREENEAKILSAIINTEEKERYKFAKELHDGLGPILSSIKMSVSAINKALLEKRNTDIIEKTEASVDNAIQSIKEISNNLSPHILERFGLEKALRNFSDTIISKNNLSVDFSSNIEKKRYEYNVEVIFYRIICELITNTLKYASASKIEILLYDYETKLDLFYSDNGIGFDIHNPRNMGMGLSNISSRVRSLDGKLEMQSKQNHGFLVKISIPL